MKKYIALLLSLIMLSACQNTNTAETPSGKIVITDSIGRETVFDTPPERVVVMSPSVVETFYFLEEQNRLIAVGTYANYPEEAKSLPKVTTAEETNIEHIISLNPDCVIMSLMNQDEAEAELISKASIPVVIIDPQTVEEVYWSLEAVGELLGKKELALQKNAEIKEKLEKLTKASKEQPQRTAYFEVAPLDYGIFTTGRNTYINELMDIVGAKNIFDDLEGWCQVSEEQIISRNPDVIMSTCGYYGIPDVAGEIISRQGWDNIIACQTKQVYSLDGDLINRPGPRLYEAAKQLYESIYGEYVE